MATYGTAKGRFTRTVIQTAHHSLRWGLTLGLCMATIGCCHTERIWPEFALHQYPSLPETEARMKADYRRTMAELLRFEEADLWKLPHDRVAYVVALAACVRPFEFQPAYLCQLKDDRGTTNAVYVEALQSTSTTRAIPNARVTIMYPEWWGNTYTFSFGWRYSIQRFDVLRGPANQSDLLVVDEYRERQYYALRQNGNQPDSEAHTVDLVLVRREGEDGELGRNFYSDNLRHWLIGPPPPTCTVDEWLERLQKGSRVDILECLTWMAGYHSGEEEKAVEELRRQAISTGILDKLVKSQDGWIRQAAVLAQEPPPPLPSFMQ